MTAQIIDLAKKRREKRLRGFLETDVSSLSPEELNALTISLKNLVITEAGENNIYPGRGYTTVMIDGVGFSLANGDLDDGG